MSERTTDMQIATSLGWRWNERSAFRPGGGVYARVYETGAPLPDPWWWLPSWHHLQNEELLNCIHWWSQGKLPQHALRRCQGDCYDSDTVTIGPPRATAHDTVAQLQALGVVGLYARLRDEG